MESGPVGNCGTLEFFIARLWPFGQCNGNPARGGFPFYQTIDTHIPQRRGGCQKNGELLSCLP